jgi:tRNA(adenine34) deaminase
MVRSGGARQGPAAAARGTPARDERWMRYALALARRAAALGEVPVGAVLVQEDALLAEGHNRPIAAHDATAHAEIAAIRAACASLGTYRLTGATLYVTLEPCAMCAGAMVHARLARLVYGAHDPKGGAAGSVFDIVDHPALNHRIPTTAGVLAGDCGEILRTFFAGRRHRPRGAEPAPPSGRVARSSSSGAPGGG